MKIAVAVSLILCGSVLVALPLLAVMFRMSHPQGDSIVCSIFGMAMVMWGAFDVPATGDVKVEQATAA
jgi:hypothetical protein